MAIRVLATLLSVMTCLSTSMLPGIARADELCPDTTKAKDLNLGNTADLQFDIDRLALCLQRAKLLQQIDETVKKREVIRQEPLGMSSNNSAMGTGLGSAVIPPMPAPSLPSLPSMPAQTDTKTTVATPAPVVTTEWKIRGIWGQGDGMRAQLAKGDMLANVKLGDILPSGEKVTELSARGITLDDGKTKHVLNWLETIKKDSVVVAPKTGQRS
jgi:hypothetical protein